MACRFCFESDSPQKNPLISPCECKGTSKYVHRGCLLKWQANTTVDAHKFTCQSCRTPYTLPTVTFEKIPYFSATMTALLSPNMFLITLHLCFLFLSLFRTRSLPLSYSIVMISTLVYGILYGVEFFQVKRKCQYIGFWVLNQTDNRSVIKPMILVFTLTLILCVYPAFPYVMSIIYCHTLFNLFQVHRDVLLTINQQLLLEF
jgi:hypothetical protein